MAPLPEIADAALHRHRSLPAGPRLRYRRGPGAARRRLTPAQRRPQLGARLHHSQEFAVSRQHDALAAFGEMPPQVTGVRRTHGRNLVRVDERNLTVRAMHFEQIQRNQQRDAADYR